ncbi:mitochondrial import receptor subunit TOM7-1 [Iris pallida]|uniref:Mitochondrial import receptor subunit TOM7-1 n=1 Tax=Iris pallida TaxID=29817 RepID=A0AAX6EVL6_IRIPA|nr:mitochondrial import receptor subunit TOM7-1 [Iris pallida]
MILLVIILVLRSLDLLNTVAQGKADKPLGSGNPLFSRATLRAWPSMAVNSVELRNPIPISKFPRKSCLMSSLRTSFSSAIDVEFSTDDLPLRLRKQRKIWSSICYFRGFFLVTRWFVT